ncbi:hypothetical protein B296_00031507, partial [Ensete ventricosum]
NRSNCSVSSIDASKILFAVPCVRGYGRKSSEKRRFRAPSLRGLDKEKEAIRIG